MEKWVVLAKKADFYAIGEKYQIDPVVARLIRNRDVPETEIGVYLNGDIDSLHNPKDMKDIQKAALLMKEKILSGAKVRILGDYDIDGINATYILYKGLVRCGAAVDYVIPDRIQDGYGLNEQLVRQAFQQQKDTLITCDNGISAREEIALAKELGMTVIITDHHDVPYETVSQEEGIVYQIPWADAVVNPKQADCAYPFKEICGAVVAWKFIMVLYESMGVPVEEAYEFLENAAFATVGDVMDLKGENRTIVRLGLKAMNETGNIGLRTLILQNGIDMGAVKAYHLGFVIGPCFNAGGRLDTAMRVMELLLETDEKKANQMAAELIELNASRKNLTEEGVKEAVAIIENAPWKQQHVYVVHLPDCHESIAGIIAGRLRERYERPVFVVTGRKDKAKGSGRSIEGYSMYEEMNCCKELFSKFGGHPLAAGFSLPEENIPLMREKLNQNETLTEDDMNTKVSIDMIMPVDYIYPGLIEQMEQLEPFGKGNPKPVFAEKNAVFVWAKRIGKSQNMLKFRIRSEKGTLLDAIYFSDAEELLEFLSDKFSESEVEAMFRGKGNLKVPFTYYPSVNSYNGMERLQMVISGFFRG